MTLECGWGKIADLLQEPNLRELIVSQWEELAKKEIPLDPDWGRIQRLEELDLYGIWTARQDGMLIGFIEWHLGPTLHHKATKYAIDGGHFIHPEFRTPWVFLKMWRSSLEALQGIGVHVILAHDNPLRPLPGAFKRLGFEPAGQMYGMVLL